MATDRNDYPKELKEGGSRPLVLRDGKRKFFVEDLVYFINDQDEKNGPFIVREILDGNKCTLSELDYTTAANGGVAVSVKSLEKVV